jgi:branched-chain amino acid transport system ATP-binding protein
MPAHTPSQQPARAGNLIVETSAVHAGYGDTTVLAGVDLRVHTGEVVALLGPNGVGKTTLLRVIGGLLRPRAGRVELDGRRIDGLPAHRVAKLGLVHVPEGRGIFPGLTVTENLDVVQFMRPERRGGELTEVLRLFPILKDRGEQRAGTLSGGEQQMLSLARALRAGPILMLLDEPSLGLAPRIVAELYDILAEVKSRSRISMLLVDQAARQAIHLADYVYVMGTGGRVVAEGPAEGFHDESVVYRAYLS